MVTTFAILSLFTGFLSCVFGQASVDRFRHRDYINKHDTLYGCIYAVLCTLLVVVGIVLFVMMIKSIPNEEHRYPVSEYNLETEITTHGEVSDTTYVIVRK